MVKKNHSGKWDLFCIMIFLISSVSYSFQVKRMDIFDKSANSLFFVNFEYNADGKNTGRSIYTADSTFLRRTIFINDATNNRSKEISLNFNNDTIGSTNVTTHNNNPGISVFDQFNLNQFGAPVSYAANGENVYSIYHNGAVVNKMRYMYTSEGDLSRIEVLSRDNSLLYYAVLTSPVGTIQRKTLRRTPEPKITFSSNRCHVSGILNSAANLRICIYNIAGQLVAVPISRNIESGMYSEFFKLEKLSNNLYIIRMYVNGKAMSSSQKFISKTEGR